MASTPARDLPLPDGELTDLLTGRVCSGSGAGLGDVLDDVLDDMLGDAAAGIGGGLSAMPQRSQ
ncbi:hypothetical protein ACFMQL_24605 [Nonomuraea fastidiosa]|uniref:hypothetical protein n=1 Tax=Nonomuraea fastidiosa TaxID=46173 RepID=UPI00366B5643